MASALCPHGWPWFEECPFCVQEPWVDGSPGLMSPGTIIQVYGKLVAFARPIRLGPGVQPVVVNPLLAGEEDWVLLTNGMSTACEPVFRFTYGVGQRGERVLSDVVNSDMARVGKE